MQAGDSALALVLRRDRMVLAGALAALSLLAWGYVVWLSARMGMPAPPPPAATMLSDGMTGMVMGGMDLGETNGPLAPDFRVWGAGDFAFMFAMWSVMMVG